MNRSFYVSQNRAEWTRGALTPAQGGRPGRAQPRLTPAQKALVLVPRRRPHLCPWNSNFKCQTLIPNHMSIFARIVLINNYNRCSYFLLKMMVSINLSNCLPCYLYFEWKCYIYIYIAIVTCESVFEKLLSYVYNLMDLKFV